MDLDQLQTFLEIVRLKSFSKAAQTRFRTQPAVSAQVRQLESELNAPLFDRLGTRISLTPAGKILCEYAEQILFLRREAQDRISELERVPRGELIIAATEATCIYVLPHVFARYKRLFPNVQLGVNRSYGSAVVQAVTDNLADFGVTQLPIEEKRLQALKIHTDEIGLATPPQHPLARQPAASCAEAGTYPLLLPRSGATRKRLDAWLEPVQDVVNISMELDSTEMMKQFVMADLGVSFLAASSCRDERATGRLAFLSLAPEPMTRHLGLVYRRDKHLSKAAQGFVQVILEDAGRRDSSARAHTATEGAVDP